MPLPRRFTHWALLLLLLPCAPSFGQGEQTSPAPAARRSALIDALVFGTEHEIDLDVLPAGTRAEAMTYQRTFRSYQAQIQRSPETARQSASALVRAAAEQLRARATCHPPQP
jgi:hypothetical protein